MRKLTLILSALTSIIAIYSCNRNEIPDPAGSGSVYLELPDSTYPYFETGVREQDTINRRATLGRVLFYDKHLSINNTIACGSCHKQAFAFSDNAALSTGYGSRVTGRNTPPIQNLGFSGMVPFQLGGFFEGQTRLFWDGRETDVEKLVMRPVSNHVEMGITDFEGLVNKLKDLPYYPKLFREAYGSEEITIEKISKSVAGFMISIRADDTRFDQYSEGKGTLSALELEGMELFNGKYNCSNCHNEQIHGYSGNSLMNIGLDAPYADQGLAAISGNSRDRGKFKVPNLRNVVLTAPYMHDGRFRSLNEVLEHYSHGIKPDENLDILLKDPASGRPLQMNITQHDKQAIVAFLGTLTDAGMISNHAYSDPFKIK